MSVIGPFGTFVIADHVCPASDDLYKIPALLSHITSVLAGETAIALTV